MLRVIDPFVLNGKTLAHGAELVGDDEKAVLAKPRFARKCVRVADRPAPAPAPAPSAAKPSSMSDKE